MRKVGNAESGQEALSYLNNMRVLPILDDSSRALLSDVKQLQHCMRASKATKGLVVTDADLIGFPQNRFQMDLYYDGECFIYTDGQSKFIIHPNYKMKVNREEVKLVNFITATRRTDKKEFNGKRYVKIQ